MFSSIFGETIPGRSLDCSAASCLWVHLFPGLQGIGVGVPGVDHQRQGEVHGHADLELEDFQHAVPLRAVQALLWEFQLEATRHAHDIYIHYIYTRKYIHTRTVHIYNCLYMCTYIWYNIYIYTYIILHILCTHFHMISIFPLRSMQPKNQTNPATKRPNSAQSNHPSRPRNRPWCSFPDHGIQLHPGEARRSSPNK